MEGRGQALTPSPPLVGGVRIHPSDLTFLVILALVVAQTTMLVAALGMAVQPGGEGIVMGLLLGVAVLGLVVILWDHLPWLHPWDRPARPADGEP